MEKYTVDLERVLDDFEYDEERIEASSVGSSTSGVSDVYNCYSNHNPPIKHPASSYRRSPFEAINLSDADFARCTKMPSVINCTNNSYHTESTSNLNAVYDDQINSDYRLALADANVLRSFPLYDNYSMKQAKTEFRPDLLQPNVNFSSYLNKDNNTARHLPDVASADIETANEIHILDEKFHGCVSNNKYDTSNSTGNTIISQSNNSDNNFYICRDNSDDKINDFSEIVKERSATEKPENLLSFNNINVEESELHSYLQELENLNSKNRSENPDKNTSSLKDITNISCIANDHQSMKIENYERLYHYDTSSISTESLINNVRNINIERFCSENENTESLSNNSKSTDIHEWTECENLYESVKDSTTNVFLNDKLNNVESLDPVVSEHSKSSEECISNHESTVLVSEETELVSSTKNGSSKLIDEYSKFDSDQIALLPSEETKLNDSLVVSTSNEDAQSIVSENQPLIENKSSINNFNDLENYEKLENLEDNGSMISNEENIQYESKCSVPKVGNCENYEEQPIIEAKILNKCYVKVENRDINLDSSSDNDVQILSKFEADFNYNNVDGGSTDSTIPLDNTSINTLDDVSSCCSDSVKIENDYVPNEYSNLSNKELFENNHYFDNTHTNSENTYYCGPAGNKINNIGKSEKNSNFVNNLQNHKNIIDTRQVDSCDFDIKLNVNFSNTANEVEDKIKLTRWNEGILEVSECADIIGKELNTEVRPVSEEMQTETLIVDDTLNDSELTNISQPHFQQNPVVSNSDHIKSSSTLGNVDCNSSTISDMEYNIPVNSGINLQIPNLVLSLDAGSSSIPSSSIGCNSVPSLSVDCVSMSPSTASVTQSLENSDSTGIEVEEDTDLKLPRPTSLNLTSHVSQETDLSSPSVASGSMITPEEQQLGKQPPFWVPDSEAPMCMHCHMKFTMIKRRHHCRGCGQVLCSKCCDMKARLEYMNFAEARVCHSCYRNLEQIEDTETRISRQPNPNNPMEYCSTISPLLQVVSSHQPLPTIHVPKPALKHEGKSKSSDVPKKVMFSDGIRPGGDLTELDQHESRLPLRKPYRVSKRVGTPPGNSLQHRRLLNPETKSFIPLSNELPPIVVKTQGESAYAELVKPVVLNEPSLKFAINRNLFLNVSRVYLDCCINREVWCMNSEGLSCVGQDEVAFIIETIPDEKYPPKDIFLIVNSLYQDAAEGNSLTEMTFLPSFSNALLGSKEHGGFVFIRPTFQCMQKLNLPKPPFLVGLLIHRWETPWARLFPIRIILRLGAEFRYYPCPLFSVRYRQSLFTDIGHTIVSLLADFRKYSFSLPMVQGLVIHMEDKSTTILLPRNRYDQVVRALKNSDENVLTFGGNISTMSDSHLVCIQSTEGDCSYQTQAINIHNKPRKVTGASFVVFNGSLKQCAWPGKSNIIEDGLMVQIPSDTMSALRSALNQMKDFSIGCGPQAEEMVILKWSKDDVNFNIGVKSCIDGKPLDGVPSIRVHNGIDYTGALRFIRWTEVFIIRADEENGNKANGDAVNIKKLSESIARATCVALLPYLDLLATANLAVLAVRATIDPDNVGYEAGSGGEKLPPLYMKSLDEELVMVVNEAAVSVQNSSPVVLELIFRIMEQG